MFKKKSLLLLLLVGLLMFFVACGDDGDDVVGGDDDPGTEDVSGGTSDDEGTDSGYTTEPPIEYHYFVGASGQDLNTNETTLGKKFEEETGVNFKMEYLVGDLMEKLGVMVVGGTYPDVIVPDHGIDMLLDAGAFIPLNDLLEEHGPNILEMYGEYLDRFTMPDGNIYYIPFGPTVNEFIPNPGIDQGAFWIQRAVLKEYDYPEIKTVDQYFDYITRYADENPQIDGMETIPFTGLTYDTSWFAFSNIPNHLAGYPNDGGVQIDMETHEASVYGDSDAAYEWLKKLNELNADGYLDQEMFVMNYDDYLAKLSSGRVLGFFDYGWQFGSARDALKDAGDPDKEFLPLPVTLSEDIEDQYLDPPSFTQNRGVGITVNAKNPERIIQYWDNLIKEENQRLVMWGEEGTHYEIDENGRYYRTEEQIALTENQEARKEFGNPTFEWNWPRLNGSFSDGNAIEPRRQAEVVQMSYSDDDLEFLEAYGVETFADQFAAPQDRPWYPAWSANITPGSEAAIFEERSEEVTQRHYPRIVLADPGDFESEWDEFVQAYRSVDNLEEYEAFFTRTIEERLKGNWQFE